MAFTTILERPYLTPAEVLQSGACPVGKTLLYRLVRSGAIPSKRIGHKVIIPKRAYLAWLETVDTPEGR